MSSNFYDALHTLKKLIIVDGGGINSDNGLFTSDGSGNVNVGTLAEKGNNESVQKVTSKDTISIGASDGIVRVTCSSAVTGVQLPSGIRSWQRLTVVHEGSAANTIAYGNSVAGGNPQNGLTARTFVWNSVTSVWYPCL